MELREAVLGRRATRDYDPTRPIPRATVEMLLNLAIRAPSAGYTQGWEFLVLDDITSRSGFWSATSDGPADTWREGMERAPVLVICLSDEGAYRARYAEPDKSVAADDRSGRHTGRDPNGWLVPYWHVDTGMAAMVLMLAAHDAGLASCLFAVPADRWPALAARLRVPDGLLPVAVVSLGYPPDPSAPPDPARAPARRTRRRRREVAEVTHWGAFAPPSAD